MNAIIPQLKRARLAKKLRQSEFGVKLGLPQSHISKIEQGRSDPRLSTVTDMARLLDQELVLVPRSMLPAIRAMLSGEETQKPKWQIDEEEGA